MADIDAEKIVMYLIEIIIAVFVVLFFILLYSALSHQFSEEDLQRTSFEISQSFVSSQLTSSKNVFDRAKLDIYNRNNFPEGPEKYRELDFLRLCGVAYHAKVESLTDGKVWEFGYKPSDDLVQNEIGQPAITKTFASIREIGEREGVYGTVTPARVTLTAYDTWFVRATCAVERAFKLKEVQEIPKCLESDVFLGVGKGVCMSLKKKDPTTACYYLKLSGGTERRIECRYIPSDIIFADTYIDYDALKSSGIDVTKATIKFYPIKSGFSPACDTLSNNMVAGKNDLVETVLICAEAKK